MSEIEKIVKDMKHKKEREGWKETKKTAVSLRLDNFTVFCLDKVMQELGGSRTSVGIQLLSAAIYDSLKALGIGLDSLHSEYMDSLGQGMFVDGIKLTLDEMEDLKNNPRKYLHPSCIREMTEDEIQHEEDLGHEAEIERMEKEEKGDK